MHDLVGLAGVEDGRPGIDADKLAILYFKAGWGIHPGVDRDNNEGGENAGDPDRKGADPVRTRREAIPAIEVDADKDGFHKEENALNGKEGTNDGASKVDIGRPEQAEFKRNHRAGDGANDKDQGDGFGPATGQQHPVGVLVPQTQPFSNTEHQW